MSTMQFVGSVRAPAGSIARLMMPPETFTLGSLRTWNVPDVMASAFMLPRQMTSSDADLRTTPLAYRRGSPSKGSATHPPDGISVVVVYRS